MLTKFEPIKIHILTAFQKGALYYCVFTMKEMGAILVVRQKLKYAANFSNIITHIFGGLLYLVKYFTVCLDNILFLLHFERDFK